MRPKYSTLLFLVVSFLLCGCPYESEVALDEKAAVKIDESLIGSWRKSSWPSDSTEITIKKKSAYEYEINAKLSDETGDYENHEFTAFFSAVNKRQLLNVYDVDEDKYFFVAVYKTDGRIRFRPLSEKITEERYRTSSELRKFLEKIYTTEFNAFDEDSEISDLQKAK